ncbi:MAG: zinc-binding dehydrogenase [Lachnospiraceae bacterium]
MRTFVIEKDGSFGLQEVPTPAINSKQALVKMIANGMCGTDVKLLHHTFKGFPKDLYPIMLGHEGVGEVVEVGSDVRGYKVGDKVLLPFVDPDETLYPGLGSGWGAMSEYGVVWDKMAVYAADEEIPDCAYAQTVLDPSLDPVDAVMLVTFREVLSNIRYFGIQPHETIVVFGCGPVGLSFIKILSLLGVSELIAVDVIEEKLESARLNGATKTFNSKEGDLPAQIRGLYPQGVNYVLDAVGSPAIVNQAMPLIADRGKVLCYGVPEKEEITIDFSKADYNWQVIYQQMPRKREEGEATAQIMEWILEGRLVIKEFISDYFKFDDSVDAFQKLLDRKIGKKGIIVF